MRLTQRLVVNSAIIIALLMTIVLVVVDWRVRHHVSADGPVATASDDILLSEIRGDIAVAGVITLAIGIVLARMLALPVARPIEELRDIALSLAAGDLSRRPSHALVGGEVGDLADALRRMSEQLETRLWEL
ncbi:MAG: HAMP domain-containing protein, partial [Gemmatimonadaceae bacterium]